MPTETKKHNATTSDVCDQVCRLHGHRLMVIPAEGDGDPIICAACGLTIVEIRSGEYTG